MVAQTKAGTRPARRSSAIAAARASGRMRSSSSVSIRRRLAAPSPAIRTAFSTDEWAWVEA